MGFRIRTKVHRHFTKASQILVSRTLTYKYDIFEFVSTAKTYKYEILNFITNLFTYKYEILNFVATTKTYLYDLYQLANRTFTYKYEIFAYISKTLTYLYEINEFLTKTLTYKYDILGFIVTTKVRRDSNSIKIMTSPLDVINLQNRTPQTIKIPTYQDSVNLRRNTTKSIVISGFTQLTKLRHYAIKRAKLVTYPTESLSLIPPIIQTVKITTSQNTTKLRRQDTQRVLIPYGG